MIQFVNAKLNLGLNITSRRPDGYHDLETLFMPVGLHNGTPANPEPFCDLLEIAPAANRTGTDFRFRFAGRSVDCPEDKNLVVRAARLFAELARERGCSVESADITLEKHLPDGAGLGGGSADASITLRMLNELNGNPLTHKELLDAALRLGADCPFFIENRPCLASGVGERLTPVDVPLSGWWAVIVKPQLSISTREAFSGVTPRRPKESLSEVIRLAPSEWRGRMVNDFETSLFPLYPVLAEIKEALYGCGAVFALMSGSGASLYGLFPTRDGALCASASMADAFPEAYRAVAML